MHPLGWVYQLYGAFFWKLVRRLGLVSSTETMNDHLRDQISPFDEHPACEICGNRSVEEKLVTADGMRIVGCSNCGLWFTSPRINENVWTNYLRQITDRAIEFTENRLKYGCALSSSIKYSLPYPLWRLRLKDRENKVLGDIENYLGGEIRRLHDVGCGVGFFLRTAREKGIKVTGNDLNAYACKVMKKRFGLEVYNVELPKLDFSKNTVDAITFQDYIEHTYHPFHDLKAAFNFLRPGGVIYIETFHIDCLKFDTLKGNWNMLFWNHLFHFSIKTMKEIIEKAGFLIEHISTDYQNPMVRVFAKKGSKQ
ncbi:MAG: class I SAM-dependent methyltransferase [Candidatus Bathyarchaeota archaeon]|nr:MAG: class I SAM-dependent methyltransferase [Candidatus Bathyarchaeota archaeon]